jgi:ketosteroid isomerase-like protein
MTTTEEANLALVRRYLDALEHGMTSSAVGDFFTPDVVQEEFPNRLIPQGARRTMADLRAAAERGGKAMSSQSFKLLHAVASGDHVACEVQWRGTLAVPYGSLPAGGEMRARFAIFLDIRDGKIAAQRNYDCFDPW